MLSRVACKGDHYLIYHPAIYHPAPYSRLPPPASRLPLPLLLIDELRDAWRNESRDHRVALAVIIVIAINLRLLYLNQPMRYDEAVTYMYFVRQPWSLALSDYTYPNNHLFHTLLAKTAVSVFGNSPWVLRLPAFIAGILIVPATYAVARALYGSRPALIAAAIVASSGVLALYSTNARGYSIVVLAFLLSVLIGVRLQRGATVRHWIAFALVAVLGLWTIPVMLYPLGAVSVWLAITFLLERKQIELGRLAITLGAAAAGTILLYSPVIARSGIAAVTRNRFVTSSGWYDFLGDLPATLWQALKSWSLGIPPIVSVLLLACAVVALARHRAVSTSRVNLSLAAYVWSAWLLVVNHRAPFPRVWLWYLPIVAALAGAGAVLLLERWSRTRRLIVERAPSIAVAFGLAAGLSVVLSFAVLLSRDTGTYRDAEDASAALSRVLRPGDRVVAAIPTNAPLAYYFDRLHVSPMYLTSPETTARRVIVVVDRAEGQTLGRVAARSEVRDTLRFTPASVIATLTSSAIFMYVRRDVSTK